MLRADYPGPILHRIIRLNELNRIFSLKTFLTIDREAMFGRGQGSRNEIGCRGFKS
jgi:hypothetical protein